MKTEEEIISAVEQYADMVRKICFIHMKQECDVDDVFQSVFLKFANAPAFQDKEHEKAWIIRVTMNCCKDTLRSWFKKKVVLYQELETLAYCNNYFPEYEDNAVLSAVLRLSYPYKDVVYLFYYEGYKVKEIAEILQRKENTIHTWLKRAKEQLKVILGGEDFA